MNKNSRHFKKKWILVLPCGKQQIKTIKLLKQKGYSVFGIDQNEQAEAFPECDSFVASGLNETEEIIVALAEQGIFPLYALPVISDKGIFPAYLLNRFFGTGEIEKNLIAYYNKYFFRLLMEKNNIPSPFFKRMSSYDATVLTEFSYPIIVKPEDSSGSRGISVLEKHDEFYIKKSIELALSFSNTGFVIVEEWISGVEYSVEGLVIRGELQVLLISQRDLYKQKTARTIKALSIEQIDYDWIKKELQNSINVLEYNNGPVHIEIIIRHQKVFIIDFASRGGGFGIFNDFVLKITGFDLAKATIEVLVEGKTTESVRHFKPGLIHFIIPVKAGKLKKFELRNSVFNDGIIFEKYQSVGDQILLDENDGSRLGTVFIYGDTEADLEEKYYIFNKSLIVEIE